MAGRLTSNGFASSMTEASSELLRRVADGETIQITDRGRPVALLAPLPEAEPLERMRATGEIVPGESDLTDLPEPLEPEPGTELPSAVLARLRRDER